MPLELQYDNKEDIPAAHAELFSEQGGKFVLTGVNGMKTQADIDKLTTALGKERTDHKTTREKYKPLEGRDLAEVMQMLDKYPELELAASDKFDPKKVDELVEKRIGVRLSPVEREKKELADKLAEQAKINETLQGQITKRDVNDAVRTAAVAAKVVDTAVEDIMLLAGTVFSVREGKVLTEDGLDPAAWLGEMKEKRAHWWPAAVGAGAGGGKGGEGSGVNPWSADGWNTTAQGKLIQEKGREAADRMAKAAGSFVGALRPTVKK